jgi:hypothetical protein
MLVSIVRSCGEKPLSPSAPLSTFCSTVWRSARAEFFQPNMARSTRASQLSPESRGATCGATGTGRFTRSSVALP